MLPMQSPHDRNGAGFVASAEDGVMVQVMISALESISNPAHQPFGKDSQLIETDAILILVHRLSLGTKLMIFL